MAFQLVELKTEIFHFQYPNSYGHSGPATLIEKRNINFQNGYQFYIGIKQARNFASAFIT